MLTVLAPPSSSALTTLAAYQAIFGAKDSAALVSALIVSKSEQIASYCQRTFGKRQVRQTDRPPVSSYLLYDPLVPATNYREPPPLVLETAGPLVSVDAVTIQGSTVLTQDVDFEVDGTRLFRLYNDRRTAWNYPKIVVDYTVGYVLPGDSGTVTLPADLQQVCLDLVRYSVSTAGRTPGVVREEFFEMARVEYDRLGGNGSAGMRGGLPEEFAQRLAPYLFHVVS